MFIECFNCLPIAASIDDKILLMHGALSPELNSVKQLRKIVRPTDVPEEDYYVIYYGVILIVLQKMGGA